MTNPSRTLPQGEGASKYRTTDPKTWVALQERALEMRKLPTVAENVLWQALRRNASGAHFRRQHIIGNFIVDFVCLQKQLVIEVDGDVHDCQFEQDEERTSFLHEKGFTVVRFGNDQVIRHTSDVLSRIIFELKALPIGEGLGEVGP